MQRMPSEAGDAVHYVVPAAIEPHTLAAEPKWAMARSCLNLYIILKI